MTNGNWRKNNNVNLIEHMISFYNIGKYQVRAKFAGHASVPLDPLYFLLAIHLSLSLSITPRGNRRSDQSIDMIYYIRNGYHSIQQSVKSIW